LTAEGKKLVKRAPNPVQGRMIYGLRNLKKGELSLIYDSVKKLGTLPYSGKKLRKKTADVLDRLGKKVRGEKK
jgi:hypothetical protein